MEPTTIIRDRDVDGTMAPVMRASACSSAVQNVEHHDETVPPSAKGLLSGAVPQVEEGETVAGLEAEKDLTEVERADLSQFTV